MNVREVLQRMVVVDPSMVNADDLAPIIERALRAAYIDGYAGRVCVPEDGVTAGVAAMVVES